MLASLALLFPSFLWSTEVFIYRQPVSDLDLRFHYEHQLLELALEKTRTQYGDFELRPSPVMNESRMIRALEAGTYQNFFVLMSFRKRYLPKMDYIPFPTQRGIAGYRLFITSELGLQKLANVRSLESLKRLSIVQGQSWLDTDILSDSGFSVTTLSYYEGMFKFISKNRADLFPRGVHELSSEYQQFSGKISNLRLDDEYAFYYVFPRFFFTSMGNEPGLNRIQEGLDIAWKDGSFQTLWSAFYQKNIDDAKLPERIIYHLNNKEIKGLPADFEKYMYRVEGLESILTK